MDGAHFLDDRSKAVTAFAPRQLDVPPIDHINERSHILKSGSADLVLVAGLTDQRQMLRRQRLRDRIEMIRMQMRDDDELNAVEDFVDADRELDERIERASGIRRPAMSRREERIDQDRSAGHVELQSGVA
jgi:D-serine deaminase-like pyridoxal phosphate-dependent protein